MSLIKNFARIEQHNKQFDLGNAAYRIGTNSLMHLSEKDFSDLFEPLDNLAEGYVLKSCIVSSNQLV